MSINIAATRARVIALPGSTGVDIALGLLDEIERLRGEVHELRLMAEEAARAENANAEDAKRERAAVVAWLRDETLCLDTCCKRVVLDLASDIERGEHRKEKA